MKNLLLFLIYSFMILPFTYGQNVTVIDVEDLEHIIHEETDKIRVINFWATWCKPCVEELPHFEKVNEDPEFNEFEVILISLDFVEDLNTRVKSFINNKDLKSRIMLIDNVDYNSWIDKVDPSWSGAIPATLMIDNRNEIRRFYEKQFRDNELFHSLKDFKNELNQIN